MRPRSARVKKPPETVQLPTAWSPRAGLIAAIAVTLLLGGIPFGLGKYIEFNSPGPFDSGAYVYSAKHLLEGARWGVDEISSAYPGTLLVNVIGVKLFGFSDTGPKIVQMILQLGALGFMFYALRRVFGSIAAVLGTVIAAVYLSAPLIAKYGNVKEQYMLAFVIAAGCSFVLYEFSGRRLWLVLSGLFAMQPYWFKPTGLSVVFAIVGYVLITGLVSRAWKKLFVEAGLFLASATAGLLFPATLYIWQGQFAKFGGVLPVMVVKLSWVALLFAAVLYYAARCWRKYQVTQQLRSVRPQIYRRGIIALAAALAAAVMAVAVTNIVVTQTSDYHTVTVGQDIATYLRQLPFVSVPVKAWHTVLGALNAVYAVSGLKGGYVEESRKVVTYSQLAPKILRYYKALSFPILAALLSIVIAGVTAAKRRLAKQPLSLQSRLVWMLAAWWILDMAFVWVSPHSYEQYYLPLCASAAVLSGYAVWKWQQSFTAAPSRMPWVLTGAGAAVVFISMAAPIFAGLRYSPDTGADYTANGGAKRRGYAEALKRVKGEQNVPWQAVGDYIRTHSDEDDTIYVWGWVPGIYVQAQRLAPVPTAYEANMHITPPHYLGERMKKLVSQLGANLPKFIVDTRKQHFPFNRPPFELWPIVPPKMFGNQNARLLSTEPREIEAYEQAWEQMLRQRFGEEEAQRFRSMKPFRDFVMTHYRVVSQFGGHVLFELRSPASVATHEHPDAQL